VSLERIDRTSLFLFITFILALIVLFGLPDSVRSYVHVSTIDLQ